MTKNLFQYPTERSLRNISRVCLNRFHEADREKLMELVANGSTEAPKQACLFLMMNRYRIVWEFMVQVISQKYLSKDSSLTKMDFYGFFLLYKLKMRQLLYGVMRQFANLNKFKKNSSGKWLFREYTF